MPALSDRLAQHGGDCLEPAGAGPVRGDDGVLSVVRQLWALLFTVKQSAELPGEKFLRIEKGGNYGWPYCYYEGLRHKLVLIARVRGDGRKVGRCSRVQGGLLIAYAPDSKARLP